MKRRLLSIIFAICLAVSLIPARALAEEGETVAETESVVETVECLEEEHPEDAADEKEGTETIVLKNTEEPSVEETVIAEDEEISAEAEAVKEEAVAGTVLNALSDNEEEEIGTEEIPSLPDKAQTIYIYCRSGNRSKQAADKLLALGYTNLIEFGGIIDYTGELEYGK